MLPPLALLSGLVIVASLWMMQHLVGLFNLRRLTIPAFFYFIYLAAILTPGFFIFNEEVTSSRWRFLFAIESVLVTVPAGIGLANFFFGYSRQEIAEYFRRSVVREPHDAAAVRLYVTLLTLALILVLINLWETPVIPLFFLLRNPGEAMTAALLREDSFKFLNSHLTYAYYVLRGTVFPFLIILALGRFRDRAEGKWRRLFWISLLVGVSYAALTIEKSLVAAIFGILFVFVYLLRGGRLGKTTAVVAPILFLSFPAAVILFAYHGSEAGTLWGMLQAIGYRLFYSPAQIVYAYFEVFPAIVPFQHGASLVKLAQLIGWKAIDIPNTVGLYMTEGGGDLDTITANSCFLGNLNADFGLPGVVLGGVLTGFVMQVVSVYILRKAKTVTNLAAYAICMWAFGLLVASSLPTVLLSGGVTFALILGRILGSGSSELTIANSPDKFVLQSHLHRDNLTRTA